MTPPQYLQFRAFSSIAPIPRHQAQRRKDGERAGEYDKPDILGNDRATERLSEHGLIAAEVILRYWLQSHHKARKRRES